MTIDELTNRITRGLQRLDAELEAQVSKAGADLVALVSNRVIQEGKNAEGSNFSDYSNTEIPAFFYFNKSRNASGEAAVRKKAKAKEKISYKEFRGLNNLNESPKNFEFTGAMWRGFGVLKVEKTATGATLTLGGRNQDSEEKIGWNSEQEKTQIIKPSVQEIQIVKNNLQAWANSLFK